MSMDDIQIARKLLNKAQNAKDKGHEFSLTFADVKKLMKRKTCYYSGVKLTDDNTQATSRTFDRINNNVGYTRDNTVACSYQVNQLKSKVIEAPKTDIAVLKKVIEEMEQYNKIYG